MKRNQFKYLENPIDLNHRIIKSFLKPGDTVIDATCGNGYDSLFCADIIQESGTIHCIDIQKIALTNTSELFDQKLLKKPNIIFHQKCHSELDSFIEAPTDFIIYNLGYLPGSDKTIKTNAQTTIASLNASFKVLKPNCLISLMVYRSHDFENEFHLIQNFLNNLDPLKFAVAKTEFQIRKNIPILFLIEKL